jgi:hypothetical protein
MKPLDLDNYQLGNGGNNSFAVIPNKLLILNLKLK